MRYRLSSSASERAFFAGENRIRHIPRRRRYYEQLGLVPLVARDPSSGHRRYSPSHVEWIEFLRSLRQTGVPLKDIRTYARLVARGPATWPARRELLAAHRTRVEQSVRRLREHHRLLTRKLRAGCAPAGLGNSPCQERASKGKVPISDER